ncbi:MAG: putative ABC exporter domain-containing protein [Verrucomicrobiota bacterium]
MIGAFAYLYTVSLKNQIIRQAKRLKRPKYLAGALAGGLYFFVFFFRPIFMSFQGGPTRSAGLNPDFLPLIEFGGALMVVLLVAQAWIIPSKRVALDFTEAEIFFLFPAPVSRRALIHFKLLKSQLAILMVAVLMAAFSRRSPGQGLFWMHGIGWWLVMSNLALHELGASFLRTRLMDAGITHWQRRLAVLTLLGAGLVLAVVWIRQAVPVPGTDLFSNGHSLLAYVQQVALSNPALYLLLPFRILVRPMLEAETGAFILACVPALALLGLQYHWVVRSQVSFEEASIEKARERAQMIEAIRGGKWHLAQPPNRQRRPWFRLRATGLRAVALFWKNLIASGSMFSLRFWTAAALIILVVGGSLRIFWPQSPFLLVSGAIPLTVGAVLVILGPQAVLLDLRQDLPATDLLKSFPLPGWQVVLGEIAAPAVILSGAQLFCLALALVLIPDLPNVKLLPVVSRLPFALAAVILLPFLNVVSLLVINGAVLLFPAWIPTGAHAPQGFEALGHRMLFMLGQIVALLLALTPAAGLFALTYWIGQYWLNGLVMVVVSAVAAALVLAVEIFIGLKMLGDLFERFDLSAEPVN